MGKAIKVCAAAAMVAMLCQPVLAENEAKFDAVVKAMTDQFAAARSMSTQIDVQTIAVMGERKQEDQGQLVVHFQRPSKFHILLNTSDEQVHIYGDGQNITTYVPEMKQYIQQPQPAEGLAHPILGMLLNGALLDADPLKAFGQTATEGKYVGEEAIGEIKADRLQFNSNEGVVNVWISQGELPRLLKLTNVQQSQSPQGAYEVTTTVNYTNWKVGPEDLTEEQLVFKPADDVKLVRQFAPPGPEVLVGSAAPAFKLEDLAGNAIALADHKEKDIVILDFWATWCGPCRSAMPIIDKVAKSFADKNVVLYAVNLREDKAKIEEFLKKQNLDVKVLRDADAAVAKLYMAKGIPQTVIIDKNGVVQAVHVGMGDDLEQKLTEELTRLVKGESLIAE